MLMLSLLCVEREGGREGGQGKEEERRDTGRRGGMEREGEVTRTWMFVEQRKFRCNLVIPRLSSFTPARRETQTM